MGTGAACTDRERLAGTRAEGGDGVPMEGCEFIQFLGNVGNCAVQGDGGGAGVSER